MNDSTTTIRIKRSTKQKLDAIGHKGMSYDDIVNNAVIELHNKQNVHIANLGVGTPNGVEYIEIRVPKHIKEITTTNLMGIDFNDTLGALCEENNIKWDE